MHGKWTVIARQICIIGVIALKTMHYLLVIQILLIIISTAHGEATLFLAACYFLQCSISCSEPFGGKIARFRYQSFIHYKKLPYT